MRKPTATRCSTQRSQSGVNEAAARQGAPIAPFLFPVAALALLALTSCGQQTVAPSAQSRSPGAEDEERIGQSARPAPPSTQTDKAPFPFAFSDGLDRPVTLAKKPMRIISLAPRNTESLFAIGAEKQIVGVTSQCNFPPEAKRIAQVGGFTVQSLSLEKIVGLQPDLVLTVGALHQPVIDKLKRHGLTVVALDADSLESLCRETKLLGRMTGHADQADALIRRLRQRVENVRKKARDIPRQERVTVFYQVWSQPLMSASRKSFIGEIIELAGGENIAADFPARYPMISEELIFRKNPDVIVAASHEFPSGEQPRIVAKPSWSNIKAVRNGRVHMIPGDAVSRCGPRFAEGLEAMAHALYPDHFPPVDPPVQASPREPTTRGRP